ncbi:uncharacterized protein [Clytia hemisphaerica]|uniref:Apple domain-containing protein n=1 Tax=Clytia hemisphaerica TaxID=252671 RepID=A0A7M5X6U6_9CNID
MRLVLLSIVFIPNFIFCQITRLPQCDKYGATFKVSKRKIKDRGNESNGRLSEELDVKSKERCSTLCIENATCKSAFYKSDKRKCHLYDKKFDESELVEDRNGAYYLWMGGKSQDDSLHGHACAESKCNVNTTERCEETCEQPNGYICHCLTGFEGEFCDGGMEACLSECGKHCGNTLMEKGSYQKYDCIHACKMRDLGLDKEACKVECQRLNPVSGCNPIVLGYTFNLCVHGFNPTNCSGNTAYPQRTGNPPIEHCKLGCDTY